MALFFICYALFGGYIVNMAGSGGDLDNMTFNPAIIFFIIGGVGFVIASVMGVLTLLASKYINEVRNYNFIFVIAILNCLTGILGILLGVFTIIELNKPHIKTLFNKS
jgi:hypothetical protein